MQKRDGYTIGTRAFTRAFERDKPAMTAALLRIAVAENDWPDAADRESFLASLRSVDTAIAVETGAPISIEDASLMTVEALALAAARRNAPLIHGLRLARANALAHALRLVPERLPSFLPHPLSEPARTEAALLLEGSRRYALFEMWAGLVWRGEGIASRIGALMPKVLFFESPENLRESLKHAQRLLRKKRAHFGEWAEVAGALRVDAPPELLRVAPSGRLGLNAHTMRDYLLRVAVQDREKSLDPDALVAGVESDPAHAAAVRELVDRLTSGLPEADMIILKCDHLTNREVGERLGITEGTVRKRRARIQADAEWKVGGADRVDALFETD